MNLESLKTAKKIIGTKQTMKAIARGEVQLVFLAKDSDERILVPLLELCKEHNVPVDQENSMEALGKACRIKVGAAAVGVLV